MNQRRSTTAILQDLDALDHIPRFLRDVGVYGVSLKDLRGSSAYLCPLVVGGEIQEGKRHLVLDSKLSDAGKLISLIHEYLHALFNNGKLGDEEGEKWTQDEENRILDLLGIILPENEQVGRGRSK